MPLPSQNSGTTASRLQTIIAGEHRSKEDKARDSYRHPLETLMFFGIHEYMTVVEIWPFVGWYSKIIAPLVKDKGLYIAATFPPNNPTDLLNQQRQEFIELVEKNPDIFGNAYIGALGSGHYEFGDDGCADMIITIRNLHNWMWDKGFHDGTPREPYYQDVLASFFQVLKPGGILAIEQHRGDPRKTQDPTATKLYVRQDYATRIIEDAGFVLLGSSEINANPKDTRDHPQGPLSLSPFFFGISEEEREQYSAIGESDRMTLKFIKPL